jgi:hypothetical protein
MRELVEQGVSWVWMGLESPRSSYVKLRGADTLKLTRELRARHQAVGLDHHRAGAPHAREHRPGNRACGGARYRFPPVHAIHAVAGHTVVRRDESRRPDARWRRPGGHPRASINSISGTRASSRDDSKKFLDGPFRRDFERNGLSIYRICHTTRNGWLPYNNDPDSRVRARFAWEARPLKDGYAAALWAIERRLRTNPAVSARIRNLRREVGREFGLASRVVANLLGPVRWWSARREERRLQAGATYEPQTIIERRNWSGTAEEMPLLAPACAEEAAV